MDVVKRLISETKKLAMEEEDVRNDLVQLKLDLLLEEQNLETAIKTQENLHLQREMVEQAVESSREKVELMKSFRNAFRTAMVLHSFLKSYIDNSEPKEVDQAKKLHEFQSIYTKMLEKYESSPLYNAIIKEEETERELTNLIGEKKAQLMKLETELSGTL